jgi:spore germination protein
VIIHTVKRGESIYSIAKNYGVSERLLALNNGIDGPLVVGEDLVILFPEKVHTVNFGETLSDIAEMYSV